MHHHGAGLRRLLRAGELAESDREALIESLKTDYRTASLEPADRVMLDYAVKLTCRPAEVSSPDIDTLRRAGFDSRAIHDICTITAYYAFVNRIADGLGVELENGQ